MSAIIYLTQAILVVIHLVTFEKFDFIYKLIMKLKRVRSKRLKEFAGEVYTTEDHELDGHSPKTYWRTVKLRKIHQSVLSWVIVVILCSVCIYCYNNGIEL